VLKLTEEKLNDPKLLQQWASTQKDIHPQDVPTVLEAAQEAYYINDVRNSEEQKRFNSQIDDVLSDIKNISILDPDLGQAGMMDQDTSFFTRGKEIAEEEFEDLVAIYREENGNEKLTRRQLREIRELVVAKTQKYVTTFKGKTVTQAAYGLEGQITDLRNTSNQYRDPDTGVIYDVVSPEDAADIVANNSSAQFRQITSNRLIQIQ
jgi:predicted nucleic acid-binding Zn ribbon protein